jgi:hypothetical protein
MDHDARCFGGTREVSRQLREVGEVSCIGRRGNDEGRLQGNPRDGRATIPRQSRFPDQGIFVSITATIFPGQRRSSIGAS